MISLKLLRAPDYTEEERKALIDFVLALRKSYLQDFLNGVKLPKSGTKPDLRARIEEALAEGTIRHANLVEFLDSVAPWGKQHVFLFAGPRRGVADWKDGDYVRRQLQEHEIERLFNARLPLILPEKLALSSITHSPTRLRVTAVQKNDYEERAREHDREELTDAGEPIRLRAYKSHISRTLVSFEWDLMANTAMLQITQLHSEIHYEQVAKEFWTLVRGWLAGDKFSPIDVRPVIHKLQELERTEKREARSHGIQFRTPRGRKLAAQSPSPRDSVLGEPPIDQAMQSVGKTGVGHLGNFYWLARNGNGSVPRNPLERDIHVVIVANKGRINFTTPNSEDVVRYVLSRVRTLS